MRGNPRRPQARRILTPGEFIPQVGGGDEVHAGGGQRRGEAETRQRGHDHVEGVLAIEEIGIEGDRRQALGLLGRDAFNDLIHQLAGQITQPCH